MRVELDAFSGRPNPTWTLSEDEARELARRLRDAPRAAPQPGEPGLGYRGFVIDNPEQADEVPSTVRVRDGLLTIMEQGHVATYRDSNGIEAWLKDLARQRGFGDLVGDAGH